MPTIGSKVLGRLGRVIAATAVVAVVATSCSSGASIGASAPTTTTGTTVDTLAAPTVVKGAATTVDAKDNLFTPEHLQVKAGTKITFANEGRNQHDIVATDPKLLDFSVAQEKFDPGEKATFTFTKPGTYAYYCSLHATATAGSMRGVITVTP